MTCYLLILPWGTVCSVKHCEKALIFTSQMVRDKSLPVKLSEMFETKNNI